MGIMNGMDPLIIDRCVQYAEKTPDGLILLSNWLSNCCPNHMVRNQNQGDQNQGEENQNQGVKCYINNLNNNINQSNMSMPPPPPGDSFGDDKVGLTRRGGFFAKLFSGPNK